jgi:LmbE family N-acetylglucosaminyl deacetylase
MTSNASPLPARPETMLPADSVRSFGPTLVVAPHPDDETLGCGGAVALLCGFALPVHVLIISDGAASHPRSLRYPPARLAALRESEARAALALLGVDESAMTFFRLPDTRVPAAGEDGFAAAVLRCRALIDGIRPQTMLAPWRREPHRDHSATSAIVRAALAEAARQPRLLEYPVWTDVLDDEQAAPRPGECNVWRLAIATVQQRKRRAIAAYRSQTTALIDDDPSGFRLSAADLARFDRGWELFFEAGV